MQSRTMELMAGYETYADATELNVDAAAEAPASTTVCITYSWASSQACVSIVSSLVTTIL